MGGLRTFSNGAGAGRAPRRLRYIFGVLLLGILGSWFLGCQAEVTSVPEAPTPQPVHPSFRFTLEELERLLSNLQAQEPRALTDQAKALILSQPQEFLSRIDELLALSAEIFLLADKENLLPEGYEPSDLVMLEDFGASTIGGPGLTLNRQGMQLRQIIISDLLSMTEAARQDRIILDISSSYRSFDYQKGLFQTWVDRLGLEEAQRVSARAGTSQHQLGTTVDFGSITPAFADHPAGRWLATRAWEFGFSLSYPEGQESLTGYAYEPWHFRWIGREATAIEKEFFEGSQFRFLLFWNMLKDDFRQGRQI